MPSMGVSLRWSVFDGQGILDVESLSLGCVELPRLGVNPDL